ncbi:hypothetical protein IOD16_25730 [Saccharothrix sp. 6-C]|uniref:Uncharacterized protein n=1 Tax=Saccharothrix texasensis TaxID=103734 RepID=A0A3N1HFU8_9PSEU|nr:MULTISPECIES: hypothetical protein [Saccharothrix]QQQ74542.1 hypothetical protein IOD16_25730 [Saccharothrix sp. 6-C]ROP41389.1 hypothetical protein EDD40_6818 [Saccharothrix texasensis]
MSTRPVATAGYESMTVQVRAGVGERRLVAAVRSLFVRHEVLRADGFTAESCVHRVSLPSCLVALAAVEDVSGDVPLRVLWLDGGASGRIVLTVRLDVLARLPWHVLLPGLVSAWSASTHLRARRASAQVS